MNTVISTFARQCVAAIGVMIALTVLLGGAYPAVVWAASRLDTHAAEGSQISDARGCNAGSSIIGIDPQPVAGQPDSFLHARVLGSSDNPMAPGDPSASASSNDGPNSQDLATMIEARRKIIAQREGVRRRRYPSMRSPAPGRGWTPTSARGTRSYRYRVSPVTAAAPRRRCRRSSTSTPRDANGVSWASPRSMCSR